LKAVAEISTQLYCYTSGFSQERSVIKDRNKSTRGQSWLLNIIIYGPIAFGETIGDFLSSFGIYLQDPFGCNRRMPYRNPHLFSDEPEETMTDSFNSPQLPDIEIERLDVGPGLLAQLMEDETPLEETEAPAIVTTDLFPYFCPPQSSFKYANETKQASKASFDLHAMS
jgi:SWI/SNF-related matrix-associated actin-dependent regulator of chromatin subfamily A3